MNTLGSNPVGQHSAALMGRPLPPAGGGPSPSSIHHGLTGLFFNPCLFAALLSCVLAQVRFVMGCCRYSPRGEGGRESEPERPYPPDNSTHTSVQCAGGKAAGAVAPGQAAGLATSFISRGDAQFAHSKRGWAYYRLGAPGGHQQHHVCPRPRGDPDRGL